MGHYSTLIGGGKGEGCLFCSDTHKIVASVVNVLTRIVASDLTRILSDLQSLQSESEKQRKEIINLKHRDACQCLQDHVQSLRKENQKLASESEQLRERNNNISYIMSDLNTKVKKVENEKQSLVTVLKILHDDYGNEIASRSCGSAQVN